MLIARDGFIGDQKLQILQKMRPPFSFYLILFIIAIIIIIIIILEVLSKVLTKLQKTIVKSRVYQSHIFMLTHIRSLVCFYTHWKHQKTSITANEYATHEYALVTTLCHQKMLHTHWYISNPTSLILLKGIIFTLLDSKIISFCSSTKYCWLVSLTSISKILWFGN